jgi:uncharacterized membrane protein YkvA (DUF1232 family)
MTADGWRARLRAWREGWVARLRALRRQALVVYYAARDPRLPWPVRLLALAVAAYALSPIDLIPDFIPVLGILDDLVLIPVGVALVLRLTPASVVADAQVRAAATAARPVSVMAAVVIVLAWSAAVLLSWLAWRRWRHH